MKGDLTMGSGLMPGGSEQQPLATHSAPSAPRPTGSLLDRVADETNRRLEYLKGHEASVGHLFKLLLFGGGGLWFMFNWQLVRDFVAGVVDIQTKAIYGGVLAFVMWIMWSVLSSKKFQYTVAMMVDRTIERFHRMIVARDPEGSARFSINRLRKRLREGQEAKGKVGAAYETVHNEAERAHGAALDAIAQARGLSQEQQNRRQGRGNPRIKLSDSQLDLALSKTKADARREYAFWQEETANAETLGARYEAIQEVLDSATVELGNMEADLDKAITRWTLNLEQMRAMEASDDLVNSRERSVFDQSMQIIQQQADMFSGRTRMILERLDPTVQSYRAGQAGAAIADDEFFATVANDPAFGLKPATQLKLVAAPERPVLPDMEQFLGATAPQGPIPIRTITRPAASGGAPKPGGSDFKDLLGG